LKELEGEDWTAVRAWLNAGGALPYEHETLDETADRLESEVEDVKEEVRGRGFPSSFGEYWEGGKEIRAAMDRAEEARAEAKKQKIRVFFDDVFGTTWSKGVADDEVPAVGGD
jgi:hypothetical protein